MSSISKTILRCHLWERSGCNRACEANSYNLPQLLLFFISDPHTAEDHSKVKDKAAYLLYEDKTSVKTAVKFSPMQSTGDLLLNVRDTKDAIDRSC